MTIAEHDNTIIIRLIEALFETVVRHDSLFAQIFSTSNSKFVDRPSYSELPSRRAELLISQANR
jgi:hypothetical protein